MNAQRTAEDITQGHPRGSGRGKDLARTAALPFSTKLILAWLSVVTLAPAVVHGCEELDILPTGSVTAAILCSALASVSGLLLFEPPRSSNARAWLGQLRARFTPPSSSTRPES